MIGAAGLVALVLLPQFENNAQAGIEDTSFLRGSFATAENFVAKPELPRISAESFSLLLADKSTPIAVDNGSEFPPKNAYKELFDLPLAQKNLDL